MIYRFQVRESVTTAQTRVKARQENVSGVLLPCFDMVSAPTAGNYFKLMLMNNLYRFRNDWIGSRWTADSKV